MKAAPDLRLYLVTDRGLSRGRSLAAVVEAAVAGGVTLVQLREKQASTREFLAEARAVQAVLAGSGVPLIINDRIDIALAVGAEGVHVGQDDMPAAEARRLIGPDRLLGLSVTNAAEAASADPAVVDYLGVGPVYPTGTKQTDVLIGPEEWQRIRAAAGGRPLVAIGGLHAGNATPVLRAGAAGLAVVSAICAAGDPRAAAAGLREIVNREMC